MGSRYPAAEGALIPTLGATRVPGPNRARAAVSEVELDPEPPSAKNAQQRQTISRTVKELASLAAMTVLALTSAPRGVVTQSNSLAAALPATTAAPPALSGRPRRAARHDGRRGARDSGSRRTGATRWAISSSAISNGLASTTAPIRRRRRSSRPLSASRSVRRNPRPFSGRASRRPRTLPDLRRSIIPPQGTGSHMAARRTTLRS